MKRNYNNLRVALIFPHFRSRSPSEILFPPLGAAALASQLRKLGIITKVFDCTFSTPENILNEIKLFSPTIAGIYSMVTMSRSCFSMAHQIRSHIPDCILAAGGPLPTLYPERFTDAFDAVFRGEADLSFPRFCQDIGLSKLSKNQLQHLDLAEYEGLFIHNNGLSIDNRQRHFTEREIQRFPLPDRRDFDHAAYQKEWIDRDGSKTASIMTTLGCPFSCDFCSRPIFGNLFRRRNMDAIFREIDFLVYLGYNAFWIADDSFTLDLQHVSAFCERIASRGLAWSCLSRVTGIDRATVRLMKRSGCGKVFLGLETGCRETLALMKKRATLQEGIDAVGLFHDEGIKTAAFFIVGYPGETIDSIEKTFSLALNLPLSEISFNIPFPLPGSPLFDRIGSIDKNKDWDTENEVTFVYDTEFDPQWLKRRIEQTMAEFAEKKFFVKYYETISAPCIPVGRK